MHCSRFDENWVKLVYDTLNRPERENKMCRMLILRYRITQLNASMYSWAHKKFRVIFRLFLVSSCRKKMCDFYVRIVFRESFPVSQWLLQKLVETITTIRPVVSYHIILYHWSLSPYNKQFTLIREIINKCLDLPYFAWIHI